MSPLAAYSSAARTPRLTVRLIVASGAAPGALRTNSGSSGKSFMYSAASAMPGAEIEPVMKLRPTGSNPAGGNLEAA